MKFQVSFVVFLYMIHVSVQYNLVRKVPFATVTETLKTHQRIACDGEILSLDCPKGTKISIQMVLYGRSAPRDSVCPPTNLQNKIFTGRDGVTCNIREAHRTVEELCQSKQNCSIITSPTLIGVSLYDPCPGVRKHIQATYKCHPTILSSTMVCQGENQSLICSDKKENIAILSSFFNSAEIDTIYCSLRTEFIKDDQDFSKAGYERLIKECERSDVTHAVSRHCHGQHSCKIKADPSLLGATACNTKHVFLNISYACMNSQNFHPEYLNHLVKKQYTKVGSYSTEEYTSSLSMNLADIYSILSAKSAMSEKNNEFESERQLTTKKPISASFGSEENKMFLSDTDEEFHVNLTVKSRTFETSDSDIERQLKTVALDSESKENTYNEEEFPINLTAKSSSPGKSEEVDHERPLITEKTEVASANGEEFYLNLTAKSSSPKKRNDFENERQLTWTPDLNIIYRIIAWVNNIIQVIKSKGWKVVLVFVLSIGLPLSCFLILIIFRLCQIYRAENDNLSETSYHLDSDLL